MSTAIAVCCPLCQLSIWWSVRTCFWLTDGGTYLLCNSFPLSFSLFLHNCLGPRKQCAFLLMVCGLCLDLMTLLCDTGMLPRRHVC